MIILEQKNVQNYFPLPKRNYKKINFVKKISRKFFLIGKSQKDAKTRKQNKKKKRGKTQKARKIKGHLKKDEKYFSNQKENQKEIKEVCFFSRWEFLGSVFYECDFSKITRRR